VHVSKDLLSDKSACNDTSVTGVSVITVRVNANVHTHSWTLHADVVNINDEISDVDVCYFRNKLTG